ncbi:ADAM 17-like protease isoform X2 [Varroa destructor]|uniref:Disintegrin domain-containing protein n=1 Tax=Varroa destructor TaxID=109461 RepID=A0A7M7K0E7_VARDE|nr:ADAM 17-like protease isoform X2 [Varroa destructor]
MANLIFWSGFCLLVATAEAPQTQSARNNSQFWLGKQVSISNAEQAALSAESFRRPRAMKQNRNPKKLAKGVPASSTLTHNHRREEPAGSNTGSLERRPPLNEVKSRRGKEEEDRSLDQGGKLFVKGAEETCFDGIFPLDPSNKTFPESPRVLNNYHCRLRVVIDYHFIRNIAGESVLRAQMIAAQLLRDVNKLFRSLSFDGSSIGFGIGVLDIRDVLVKWYIHSYYNELSESIYDVLSYFAWTDLRINEDYCGALLITARFFTKCASTSSAYSGNISFDSGVCSKVRRQWRWPPLPRESYVQYTVANVGLANLYKNNLTIPRRSQIMTIAQVLARMMGASTQEGSRTIMDWLDNPEALSMEFSSTTVREMSTLLRRKQSTECFSKDSLCGNERLDPGEECDEGFEGGPCCGLTCHFKRGAVCSDLNHECCDQCQFESDQTFCRPAGIDCDDARRCLGTSAVCAPASSMKDGTSCRNHGRCEAGVCRHFCEVFGYQRCACKGKDACKICCMRNNGRCSPFVPAIYATDGTQCTGSEEHGAVCFRGTCVNYCKRYKMTGCACPDAGRGAERQLCCMLDKVCMPILNLA